MTAAAKQMSTEDRWALAEVIAKTLGLSHVTKRDAFNKLSEILRRDMGSEYWANVSRGDAREACQNIFPEPNALGVISAQGEHRPRRSRRNDSPAEGQDALRLALWFIDKCVDLETAERAFKAAVAATKEMEDGEPT